MNFKSLGLIEPLLKALENVGYQQPTPIQAQAIPYVLEGRDLLGLAQTGTGKTAAFALPTLQRLSERTYKGKAKIRALILTPTRELAIQIQESFTSYGKYLPLKSTVIFGGVGQGNQVRALQAGVDVLIATPGRLEDLYQQGYLDFSAIELFTLDEADRMLDMGFIHEVKRIIKLLPKKKQTLLFSATMPKEIQEIVKQLLVNPATVSVTPVSSTVDTVQQSVYFVDKNHKIDLLNDLFNTIGFDSVLIFTRTKHGADRVVRDLVKRKVKAMAIHGNKSQNARQRALESFKENDIHVLVATDIASRGIDINDLKMVINYDLPEVPETYVHRIGRTGRAGRSGMSITLCTFQDKPLLDEIEKLIKLDIPVVSDHKYPMADFTPKEKKGQSNKPNPAKKKSKRDGNLRYDARQGQSRKPSKQGGSRRERKK